MTNTTRIAMIGCGGMARYHIREIMKQADGSEITVMCEPSEAAYAASAQLYTDAGLEPPPNQPDIARLLDEHPLDAAFIITPHAFHHAQTVACLEAGLDVLLEKPMVINGAEAEDLIAVQQRTGRMLVVAFPGSLSPQIRKAVAMLRGGELGRLLSISATLWQDWGPNTVGTWRQVPALAGGGFLFDTGAHMLNTVVDLAGEEFAQVAAWLEANDRPVETVGMVMGRLRSGAWVTMHACGETIPSCASDLRVFCSDAILRTGIWGERLEIQRRGAEQLRAVRTPPSTGVWQQFQAVRRGEIANPSPPEVGLRMARLYDAIKASAAQGGQPIQLQ
ncbi:MAG TPA: Gfo/Idh/MocA family oxidoreductase [Anaerolineae bacterium]|nr:Gfo/Idh/MocA family oxidoreductase [Anaerolineae bacterium]HNU05167.1 Gfo/Idh/MocA family oxidoreductase [Anaerolineae bacterium]